MRLLIILLNSFFVVFTLNAGLIDWDTKEVELTLTPEQKDARAIFTLTNNSDQAIRLSKVKTSCGCTGSILKKKVIEPGEQGEIIGTFHKGRRVGKNRNKLEVFIEGVDNPVAELYMIVHIPELIKVEPKIVYWNSRAAKEPKEVTVTLDQTYLSKYSEITLDAELFSIEKRSDPLKPNELQLVISPKKYDSATRDTLVITAVGPNGVTAEGRAHIFVQP
jgi:hypothetical protein